MISVTVTAAMRAPGPKLTDPPMLDALLGVGLAIWLHRQDPVLHPKFNPAVWDMPLPLAEVHCGALWWWAASQALPAGPERAYHLHRRAPVEWYVRHRAGGPVDMKAGPDKSQRYRKHVWAACRELTWTAVVDDNNVAHVNALLGWDLPPLALLHKLLSVVSHVGALSAHGIGWVDAWEVVAGGPELIDYATCPDLRHLPVELVGEWPAAAVPKHLPLRPPYWSGADRMACVQVRP